MFRKAFLAGLTLVSLSPLAAQASENMLDGSFSGNVSLNTDWIFRGVSMTNEGPAVQGKVFYNTDTGVYLGVWGSNVNFNDGDEAHVEVNYYAGYASGIGNWKYDLGLIYYSYPGADSSLDYDFIEAAASMAYDFDLFSVGGAFNYSPDYWGGTGDSFYYAGNVHVPLPANFGIGGHVGYHDIDDLPDRTEWGGYVGYNWEQFDFAVKYTDTDLTRTECPDGCDEHITFSVTRSFD